jgi:hypothetical protein
LDEHDGERMRKTIEALMSEHITQETYEQWRREASQEVTEKLEEGADIPPPGRSVRSSRGARSYASRRGLRERCRPRCVLSPDSLESKISLSPTTMYFYYVQCTGVGMPT